MFLNSYRFTSLPSRQSLHDIHQQMIDKFYDEFFGNKKYFNISNSNYPKMDIYEDENYFFLDFAVPGVEEKDLDIEIVKETKLLTIKGSSRILKDKEYYHHLKELKQSAFARTVQLPENIDIEPEVSFLSNGVLKLSFKKNPTKELEPKETVKKIHLNKK